MEKVSAEIQMRSGLSLKMAAHIADTAARCNVRGCLVKKDQNYNIGSVLQMASSGINAQDWITVSCMGTRAEEAMEIFLKILQEKE